MLQFLKNSWRQKEKDSKKLWIAQKAYWITVLVGICAFTMNSNAATCACQCQVIPDPVPSPPTSSCRVGQPVAMRFPKRGLYVSLKSSQIGIYKLPTHLQNILGDRGKEDVLLRFAISHGFSGLSYYDLNRILSNNSGVLALRSFIAAARSCGISDHSGIGSSKPDFDAIKSFGFDTALTEIEFWNEPEATTAFNDYLGTLKYIRSLGLKVQTYMGWLGRIPGQTEAQVAAQIAPLIDRALLHCYVRNPTSAFGYCLSRIGAFTQANRNLEIWPIFSAEGQQARAGEEIFMGDWLKTGSIDLAETLFQKNMATTFPTSIDQIKGFQWYEYGFFAPN